MMMAAACHVPMMIMCYTVDQGDAFAAFVFRLGQKTKLWLTIILTYTDRFW